MMEPVDVDTNSDTSEIAGTLLGVTVCGNGITEPLHGITEINALDHSYSKQNNDSAPVNLDYYATAEDEDDAIDGLL